MRTDLYAQVLRQPIAFHERERVGQIASRLTNDVNALAESPPAARSTWWPTC